MTSIIKVDTLQKANGGTPTAADLGINTSGTVLQVVNEYSTNQVSSTTLSRITLNSLSVTPVATGSKFLIQFFLYANWGPAHNGFVAYMYIDSNEIAKSGNQHSIYTNAISDQYLGGAWSYIDNTGSTAGTAITFDLRARNYQTANVNYSHATQSRGFIITEIAG